MSEHNGSLSNPKLDPDALRAEIRRTRADLGETVQALAAKADVKARASDQLEQTRARVVEAAHQATDRVRAAAVSATDGVVHESGAVAERVRRNPMGVAAVLTGVCAAIGVIVFVRARRR